MLNATQFAEEQKTAVCACGCQKPATSRISIGKRIVISFWIADGCTDAMVVWARAHRAIDNISPRKTRRKRSAQL